MLPTKRISGITGGRGPLSIAWSSVQKRGFLATVRMAYADYAFDRRYQTETKGLVGVGELAPVDPAALDEAALYQPANVWIARELMLKLSSDPSLDVLIDYGSGKGRVLIVAAELGFRRVVGIEFSPMLVATAKANIEAYRCRTGDVRDIDLVTANAATVEVADDVTVAFFYNPFGPAIMQGVMGMVQRSLMRRPRRFRIGYVNPAYGDVVLKAGFRESFQMRSGKGHVEAIAYVNAEAI